MGARSWTLHGCPTLWGVPLGSASETAFLASVGKSGAASVAPRPKNLAAYLT